MRRLGDPLGPRIVHIRRVRRQYDVIALQCDRHRAQLAAETRSRYAAAARWIKECPV